MSDYSLMNPDFLKKELDDSIELYAKAQTETREIQISLDRILGYFIGQELNAETPDVFTLNADQVRDIANTLTQISIHNEVSLSPRRVSISQRKQLLKDRRYRIATKLTRLFR